MEYGRFLENGKKYEILTPLTPGPWSNCLYNDSYYLEISQTMQGAGCVVKDYTRSACLKKYRYFYLADRESGEVWNPNYIPLAKEPESYSCVHEIWNSQIKSRQHGIETTIQVVVPSEGTREIWTVTLRNQSEKTRQISLYSVFGFYDQGVMGGECIYDEDAEVIIKYAFPYHVYYEDKEKVMKEKAFFYFFADRKPASADMSEERFFGGQGEYGIPAGVKRGKLSGINGEAEEFCGAFSFDFSLEPGERVELFLEAGAAVTREEILERKRGFRKETVEKAFRETAAYWEDALDGFYIETPDENLNAFANYWLKKQITLLTRHNRGGTYCPVRNQLQDALGYAMLQPKRAGKYFFDVLKLQNQNGFIKQWYDTSGAPPRALCLLNHTDGPVWLVICIEAFIRQSGNRELLKKQIPYADGGSGTVLEHMKRAMLYLSGQCGEHGMCLMGDGDWNDPINGPGREGKGESVWLSMAFVYAAGLLLPYLEKADGEAYEKIAQAAESMTRAINTYAWCGKQYALAIHDNGSLLGGPEDRLFLNTQSWAIISGVADEQRARVLMNTVAEKLTTPFGPLILDTPFSEWDDRWGRVSVKKSGTTENGSVYCHASMFYAFAQACMGDGDGLYETIWRTLPTNPENPPEKNLQLPTFLPNYYYGLRDSANFGRSSRHYGTGTVAWMLMLLLEELLGVKATADGIRLQPCLPHKWDVAVCIRKYRNAEYHILIQRGSANSVRVDGVPYMETYLPYEEGKTYRVTVTIL